MLLFGICVNTQQTNTCSKLTKQTTKLLENMFKVNNKFIRTMSVVSNIFRECDFSLTKTQHKFHFQLQLQKQFNINCTPVGNYMFKVNNRNTRARSEICSKLTIKIPEQRHWRGSGIFTVNFEHISHLVLVFLLLTLRR